MGNREAYEELLPIVQAIKDEEIIDQRNIPIPIYIQEAENLFKWMQPDKDILVAKKLDIVIADSIPKRSGGLREAESIWSSQRFTKKETGELWEKRSPLAIDMRSELLHEFRHVYRKNSYILGRVNAIAGSNSFPVMIQDLNNLSVLGKSNPLELKDNDFDMTKLDAAAAMASELAELLASSNAEADYSEAKKIRDQFFTYLKWAVDEVCEIAQYAFWRDDGRKRGYSSHYLRRVRRRSAKKNGSNEENEDENKE